jgi:YbbR domain-containing protein
VEEGRVRRFLDTRFLFAVLSVVIAAVMWLYVATDKNPVVERILTLDLHVRGLSPNEVVVQAPSRVQVRLQGSRAAITPLTPDVLDASLDLSGLAPGEHEVRVEVAAPAGDVRVVERNPAVAVVVLDQLTTKQLPVEAGLIGAPPEGITLGVPQIHPQRVTISGAAVQVQEVRHAVVTVDTSRLQQQLLTSLPVRLLDANGQEVFKVVITPSIVQVMLPVNTGTITKLLPVVPTLAGVPPSDLAVTQVTALPGTVMVSGPSTTLQEMQAIATVPIPLGSARQDVVRQTALALPIGVTASPREVTVDVRIGPAPVARVFTGVALHPTGVAAGLTAHLTPDRVEVTLVGPSDTLDRLSPGAVVVRVDASGLGLGVHKATPKVVAPAGVRAAGVSPAEVTVTLASAH